MPNIKVKVENKIALNETPQIEIVCRNSDYEIEFSFDGEWDEHITKTAYFVYNGISVPVPFNGNVCEVPVLENTTQCKVGVEAGNIKTTTSAYLRCRKAVTDDGGETPDAPTESVYNKIVELVNGISVQVDGLGATADLSVDENYVLTISLKNADGEILSTSSVDLPIESFVVSAIYDKEQKAIIFTLQSGETLTVPIDDIISGCVDEEAVKKLIEEETADLQPKKDEKLQTTDKTVIGAINEVKGIAETAKMVFGETEGTAYEGNKGKANADNIEKLQNEVALVNVALEQSGLVNKYKQPITQEYTERVTANGLNVVDGSKAILEKVVGSTVRCENLLNIEKVDVNNGTDYSKEGNAVTYRGNVGNGEYNYDAGQIMIPLSNANEILANGISVHKDKTYTLSFDFLLKEKGAYGAGIRVLAYDSKINMFYQSDDISGTIGVTVSKKIKIISTVDGKISIEFRINNNYVTLSNIQVREGDYTNTELPPYQPYFTGLKSASFAGIESKNAEGTETSTLAFPKTEMPLGTTIDFENKKIIEKYAQYTFTGEEEIAKYGEIPSGKYYRYLVSIISKMKIGVAQNGICDKYPTDKSSWLSPSRECIRFGQGNSAVYLFLLDNLTVDEIRSLIVGMTIRYPVKNPTETSFTEAQSAIGNEYTAYKSGTEKVLDNDGAEYEADNTLTQNYILVAEVN